MLNLRLKDALGRVTTAEQAYILWSIHAQELVGFNFILSRNGDSHVGPKTRTTFGKSGFLASLFCKDNLYFINNEIHDLTEKKLDFQIGVNFDILFDANAASYLPAAFEGSESPSVTDFIEMIRQFKGNRTNWNSAFYQIENSEAFLRGERFSDLFRVALAAEKWTDMDLDWFNKEGKLKARKTDEAYFSASNEYLATWHRSLRNGALKQFLWQFELMYVLLLQMVIIQLRWPSSRDAYKKLTAYLKILHHEWHTMFLRILFVAWELFRRPAGSLRFFNPVQFKTKDIVSKLHGMAWDLRHFQFLEQIQLVKSGKEKFLIPYFLTFDKGLAELWDLYPIRSCLIHENDGHPLCFPDRDITEEFKGAFPDKTAELEQYFTFEAADERRKSKPSLDQLPDQARELEKELFALMRQ
jgi:hypothetical protein